MYPVMGDDDDWHSAIGRWRVALIAAGRPSTTIRTRTQHLEQLARERPNLQPWSTTTNDLLEWLGSHDWKRETRRAARASLVGFYAWGVQAGHVATSPAEALPKVAASPPSPKPAGDLDYRRALAHSDDARVRLAVRLAAEAGLRRGEVVQVHARDLLTDLYGRSLIVHGKGGRDRVVPLTDDLAETLEAACAGGYAFPGQIDGHLSALWLGKLVSDALPPGVTMHSLRHRFATRAYAVDRDLLTVQRLLGHASPETTLRYVRVPDDALRRTVEAVA